VSKKTSSSRICVPAAAQTPGGIELGLDATCQIN
jgi:hypothetical protein